MKSRKTAQNKMLVSTMVALLVIGIAAVAVAQGPGQGQGKGRGGSGDGNFGTEMRLERMAQRLDLTADQVKTITEIRENGRSENQAMRKQMMRLNNEKRGEMLKDDPSDKTVLDLTTKIGDLRTEMQTTRMGNRLAVRKVLTPEQRDKMLLQSERRGGRDGFEKQGQRGKNRGGCDNDGSGQQRKGSGRGNW